MKMCKNGDFRHFRPENMIFKNRTPTYFRNCHFASVRAKFHEKILSIAQDVKEIPFFRRKSAVPAIFREFRLQKSVLLTMEPCLMVGIVINNVFCKKTKQY